MGGAGAVALRAGATCAETRAHFPVTVMDVGREGWRSMLLKLGDEIRECCRHALEAKRNADTATNPTTKADCSRDGAALAFSRPQL